MIWLWISYIRSSYVTCIQTAGISKDARHETLQGCFMQPDATTYQFSGKCGERFGKLSSYDWCNYLTLETIDSELKHFQSFSAISYEKYYLYSTSQLPLCLPQLNSLDNLDAE